MAEEIERNCIELGEEGRLIRMQLDELMEDVPREKAALVFDYEASGDPASAGDPRAPLGASLPAAPRPRGADRAPRPPARRQPARPDGRAARLPGAAQLPRLPDGVIRHVVRDFGVSRRDHPREPPRPRGGRRRRLGPRARHPRGAATPPGAQPRRPLPPALSPISARTGAAPRARLRTKIPGKLHVLCDFTVEWPVPREPLRFFFWSSQGGARVVRRRRQGRIPPPWRRNRGAEGTEAGPAAGTRVPDNPDPAQRHDRQRADRERRARRPAKGDRRAAWSSRCSRC